MLAFCDFHVTDSRDFAWAGRLGGGRGGSSGGVFPIWARPSRCSYFCVILPIYSRFSRVCQGFSRSVFFLLGLSYKEHSGDPKGSATQSGPFPTKAGKVPVWGTPPVYLASNRGWIVEIVMWTSKLQEQDHQSDQTLANSQLSSLGKDWHIVEVP